MLGKQNEVVSHMRAAASGRGGGARDGAGVDRGRVREAGVRVPDSGGGAVGRDTTIHTWPNVAITSHRAPRGVEAAGALLERKNEKIAAVPHRLRSSCRDSRRPSQETDHPREMVEAALAHVVGNRSRRPTRRRTCSSGGGSCTIGLSTFDSVTHPRHRPIVKPAEHEFAESPHRDPSV